ncbi:MAG: cation:proton antiporter [Firmicutes bacterium]|nr:cation:proton antiporter [Bacillota bacterium]
MAKAALEVCAIVLMLLTFLSFSRAIAGPTPADRVVAVNVIGTKTVVIVSTLAFVYDSLHFLDVSLVYALMSFLATCGIAAYLEKGKVIDPRVLVDPGIRGGSAGGPGDLLFHGGNHRSPEVPGCSAPYPRDN